jgi:hypothetical protein
MRKVPRTRGRVGIDAQEGEGGRRTAGLRAQQREIANHLPSGFWRARVPASARTPVRLAVRFPR